MGKCGLTFMGWYGVKMDLKCEKELLHNGPHEDSGFVWGFLDQSQDPFAQERKASAAQEKARRKTSWLKRLTGAKQ